MPPGGRLGGHIPLDPTKFTLCSLKDSSFLVFPITMFLIRWPWFPEAARKGVHVDLLPETPGP